MTARSASRALARRGRAALDAAGRSAAAVHPAPGNGQEAGESERVPEPGLPSTSGPGLREPGLGGMDSPLVVVFLAVIALTALLQAGFVGALAFAMRTGNRKLADIEETFEQSVVPQIRSAARLTAKAAELSEKSLAQALRVDTLVADASRKAERYLDEATREAGGSRGARGRPRGLGDRRPRGARSAITASCGSSRARPPSSPACSAPWKCGRRRRRRRATRTARTTTRTKTPTTTTAVRRRSQASA